MNMNKEYRAELRGLKKAKAKIERDQKNHERVLMRCNRQAEMNFRRQLAANDRDRKRSLKASTKASARITNRIAVLEGRLS